MRLFSQATHERPVRFVPRWILAAIPILLGIQIVWRSTQFGPQEHHRVQLPVPPLTNELRLASLDDPIAAAKILMLWLQAFDNQPGFSIPFRELDFTLLTRWLGRLLELDPRAQYPLLVASHLYAETPVESKQREMLAFIHEQFLRAPDRQWPWMAHAVFIAKHRLHDLPLALRYAHDLATHANGNAVPHWAQQMHIFVLEDLGEIGSARLLLQALLDSGKIADANEKQFLEQRLQTLAEQEKQQ